MNSSDINPNLPCLRPLTCGRRQNRQMSTSTNSKSTHSSTTTSSSKTNGLDRSCSTLPVLIQLCIYPDENYACRTMRLLFSSRYHYSPNICDEFGCNILMYALRYQRYHLFEYLLNEVSFDINLHARDRQGNTILHYAILYGDSDMQVIEQLIDKYQKFALDIDERNAFGFTPLLLAVYCGRYDYALTLLTQSDASPFVRDDIQSRNMLDFLDTDVKQKESSNKLPESRQSTRLRMQVHQTLLPRPQSSPHTVQNHAHKNFFESMFTSAVNDLSGSIRSTIIQTFGDVQCSTSSSSLKRLFAYLNRRYPRIKTARQDKHPTESTQTTKLVFQRENSKTSLHNIFNLFDPDLRSKAIPPPPPPPPPSVAVKPPITFKRLGTKLTVLAALSRPPIGKAGGGFSFLTSGSK